MPCDPKLLLLVFAACIISAFSFQLGSNQITNLRTTQNNVCQPMRSRISYSKTHLFQDLRKKSVDQGLSMAVTLYGSKGSRSPLVEWYLHEIGTPYTHKEDRVGLPNPFGQIPALVDGDVEIFESGAILLYLADKYGGLDTPSKRAAVTKWVLWANAALDPALFTQNIEARAPRLLETLNRVLEGRQYLTGSEFSVADVAVASYLLFIPMFHPTFQASRFPNVLQYMARCVERPAYEKAFGAGAARPRSYVAAQGAGAPKKAFGLF